MIVAAMTGTSLVDYPGKISSVVFTQGCNYDCYYCHNRALIAFNSCNSCNSSNSFKSQLAQDSEHHDDSVTNSSEALSLDRIFALMRRRKGLVEGIVVTGGEPTVHADLPQFLAQVKDLGFAVKLDTNGSNPSMVARLLDRKLVDYVAMDIKAPWDHYQQICGKSANSSEVIKTLALLAEAGVDWEVRTTVCPSLTQHDMDAIGAQIPTGVLWRWNEYRIPDVYRQEDSAIIHAPAWTKNGGWGNF
jgi:pyruvate formate lyase activating enzyme